MPVNKTQTAAAIDNFLQFIITLLQGRMPAQRISLKEPSLGGQEPANILHDFLRGRKPAPRFAGRQGETDD